MTNKEIETMIRELRNIQTLIDEAEKEAESIKDQIKSVMGETEEIYAGEYKVTWRSVTTAKLDTQALKKALPDIAKQFTKETTIRRFCIA